LVEKACTLRWWELEHLLCEEFYRDGHGVSPDFRGVACHNGRLEVGKGGFCDA
jgi:hypothetical protein